ncbi:hypothetical protein AAVH_40680, partial [Aphelenchoides avenae]
EPIANQCNKRPEIASIRRILGTRFGFVDNTKHEYLVKVDGKDELVWLQEAHAGEFRQLVDAYKKETREPHLRRKVGIEYFVGRDAQRRSGRCSRSRNRSKSHSDLVDFKANNNDDVSTIELNVPSEWLAELLSGSTGAAGSDVPQNVDAQAHSSGVQPANRFEWTSADENKRMEDMWLLIDSLRVNGKVDEAADWILRLLHLLLPAEDGNTAADDCFARCLNTLIELKCSEFDKKKLCEIGALLSKFARMGRWTASTALWKACYVIAQHREGDITEEYMRRLYSPESKTQFRLPTKALLILKLGHEALGELKKCDTEEGTFIRFYLEAIGEAMAHPMVRELFRKDPA